MILILWRYFELVIVKHLIEAFGGDWLLWFLVACMIAIMLMVLGGTKK